MVRKFVNLGLLLLSIALLGTACEQQTEQIEWQMPLEAPEDPHGNQQAYAEVPEWAATRLGEAEIAWLNKHTTKIHASRTALGGISKVGDLDIRLLGLASGLRVKNGAFLDDENVDNPAAFVEISHRGKIIYRGWLYEKFPEMFGMDDPDWKVWLKGISIRPTEE